MKRPNTIQVVLMTGVAVALYAVVSVTNRYTVSSGWPAIRLDRWTGQAWRLRSGWEPIPEIPQTILADTTTDIPIERGKR